MLMFKRIGIPDMFIEHGDVNQLLEEINITSDDIVEVSEINIKRIIQVYSS